MNYRNLTPTSAPLPPQDIHPDELKVILAEAAERHAEATAALEAAQDLFDAADRQRAYAQTEEDKRLAREERFRIDFLREIVPQLDDDAEGFSRRFHRLCAEEPIRFDAVVDMFVYWSRYRMLAHKVRALVIRYDSEQSRDDYISWVHRVSGWGQLIRSVTSYRNGGALSGPDDDAEGLAAVNARITAESQDAPHPLTREATDDMTPFVEDLGIRDPAVAGLFVAPLQALEFSMALSEAIAKATTAWTEESIGLMKDDLRERFAVKAAEEAAAHRE